MRRLWLFVRFLLLSLGAVVLAFVFAATLAGFLPQPEYLIDQLSQLRLGYIIVLAMLSLLFVSLRSRWYIAISLAAILLNLLAYPGLFLADRHGNAGQGLKILSANIYGQHNYDVAALINAVKEKSPDVLCIEESTPQWLKNIRQALPEYPHVIDEGILGGSALLSKQPIQKIEMPKTPRRFGVRGIIELKNRPVLLIVSHPPAPQGSTRWRNRNRELSRLANDVKLADKPVIIVGDLNSTCWSSYFQQLIDTARLRDSQDGYGLQPSWSTLMPLQLVPIDHCLYTDNFITTARQLGPDIHSDHLPLFVCLSPKWSATD